MSRDEKWLLWGLVLFVVFTLVYWGVLKVSQGKPTLITSRVENFLNETILSLGITEDSLVEKFFTEEKGRILVREEFALSPGKDLDEVVKKLIERLRSAGFNCRWEKKNGEWRVEVGKGKYFTHILHLKESSEP